MSLSFFVQPKINRIASHLESTLSEICRQRWTAYLDTVGSTSYTIQYNNHLKNGEIDPHKLANTASLFRPKDHFSWDLAFPKEDDEDYRLLLDNVEKQYIFYSDLVKKSRQINEQLSLFEPNYALIIQLAKEIKDASTVVPCVDSGTDLDLVIGWDLGGNIVSDLFSGIVGVIHAPIMVLISVFCIPAYCFSSSEYCGGASFFLDAISYFCTSVCQILASFLFPLNMLYSKYTTDSFNTITKGDVERTLEGLISLATNQMGTSKGEISRESPIAPNPGSCDNEAIIFT